MLDTINCVSVGRFARLGTVDFVNLLTGPELLEMTEEHLPQHRERHYPPTVTLSMFMKQSLALDRSCQTSGRCRGGTASARLCSREGCRHFHDSMPRCRMGSGGHSSKLCFPRIYENLRIAKCHRSEGIQYRPYDFQRGLGALSRDK